MRTTHFSLLSLWFTSLSLLAQGHLILPPNRPNPTRAIEVREVGVSVHIEGQSAVTEVTHVFYNPGPRFSEGFFVFPLPHGAVIEDFARFVDLN